jgi:hypothetical protein
MARVNPAGQWLDMLPRVAEAQAAGGGMFGPAIQRRRQAQADRIARENDAWAQGMAPAPEGFQGLMGGLMADDPGAVQQVLAETAMGGFGGGLVNRAVETAMSDALRGGAAKARKFLDPRRGRGVVAQGAADDTAAELATQMYMRNEGVPPDNVERFMDSLEYLDEALDSGDWTLDTAEGLARGGFEGDDPYLLAAIQARQQLAAQKPSVASKVGDFFNPRASSGGLGTFGGQMARTADLDALESAKRLTDAGESREQVWYQTGWMLGPDGKWKFEISDDAATFKELTRDSARYGDVVSNPGVEEAYPWMPNVELRRTRKPNPAQGSFSVENKRPVVSLREDVADVSTPIHEAAHVVQAVEGFGRGTNPAHMAGPVNEARERLLQAVSRQEREAAKEALDALGGEGVAFAKNPAYEAYRRVLGEADARLAQKRQPMTWAERRARPPWLDYDVPESELIVK